MRQADPHGANHRHTSFVRSCRIFISLFHMVSRIRYFLRVHLTMEYLGSRQGEIITLAHKRSNTSGMSTLEDVVEGKDYNFPVEV